MKTTKESMKADIFKLFQKWNEESNDFVTAKNWLDPEIITKSAELFMTLESMFLEVVDEVTSVSK